MDDVGLKETIHQLQINIDRLGTIPTLLLIDHLQQLNQTGFILTLNRYPQLKRYLTLFIEHVSSGRCVVVYLERLLEQMNNCVEISTMKKGLLTNQINSFLQKEKLTSKNDQQISVSVLLNLAQQGQLAAISQETLPAMNFEMDEDNLQSLIVFLQEQSSAGVLPSRSVSHFLQYLHHFASLGILYEPNILHLLTVLHQCKDRNTITLPTYQLIFNQIQTINYLSTYPSFDLIELDQFLDELVLQGKQTHIHPNELTFILRRINPRSIMVYSRSID